MRVLLSTVSPATYMRPPQLGDEQIVCGPDWADDCTVAGRWRSLRTPAGVYDLGAVLAKLPPDQQPDVVVCLVDASRRNLPKNLRAFSGPKILLIADTHHLQAPLLTMIRYAASEPFDRLVFLYDRHHADIFRGAGFQNLHWFPGLTFPHSDATVRASWRRGARLPQVAFVGQAGRLHPRRTRLLSALTTARLPLAQKAVPQADALPFYGSSLLGFNSSLNGDLNLRVFEILASGALLVTDQLSPAAGLGHLLADGRDCLFYRDEAGLVEKVSTQLRQPREAQALGEAGAQRFLEILGEERRRAMFRALAFDNVSPEPFPLAEAGVTRVDFAGTREVLGSAMVYEGVQELHRVQEGVRVVLDPAAPESFARLCATLPRVRVSRATEAAGADLHVATATNAEAAAAGGATRVWCWDATENQMPELAGRFAAAGYAAASKDLAVFCRDARAAAQPTAAEQAAQARMLFQRGDINGALELGRAALQRDGRCIGALTVLADLALLKQGGPLAEKLLRQARGLAPKDAAIAAALAEALLLQTRILEAETAAHEALRLDPAELRALLAQAQLREKQVRPAEAITVLRSATRLHPESTVAATRLGLALRRNGQVLEGLDWQRRALGGEAGITPVDPAERPVRVAFIVQHPQGWSSLESVWRALADDPAFETSIIAAPYQHPYPTEGGPEAIFAFLKKERVPFKRWDHAPLEPGFADIVFVQNPYDVTRPAPLRTPALVKLVPRLAYVPYGLEIGGGEANAVNQFNMPLQQTAWAVFARSPRHHAMFARHCAAGSAHVAVTGHPKLDQVRELDRLPADAEFTAFARGRKIVFWNPQFDIRPDGAGYSTFMLWQEFLLKEFARRPELVLVIRPHPLFFGTLEARKLWTKAQVNDFLSRVARAGNVLIDRRASYLPVFAASAAMLSDASSFLLEYTATGKPLLYLHNPTGPLLNDDGEFIRTHNYTATTGAEIARFLDQVTAGEDPRGAARRAAYPEVMHLPAQGVAGAIKQHILDRLAAEARRAAPALVAV